MIRKKAKGDWSNTNNYLQRCLSVVKASRFDKYGLAGLDALRDATPKDTGKTSESWSYEIVYNRDYIEIVWKNSNINDGYVVAVLLQYGHATEDGHFVRGKDFINPSIKKVFESIAEDAWKEIKG